MNSAKTIAEIEAKLKQGISKKQIYTELGGTDDLATAIASAPYYEDRKRYSGLNTILVVILSYAALLKAVNVVVAVRTLHLPVYVALIGLFYPFVFGFLALQVSRFRGWAYLPSSMFCAILLINSLEPVFTKLKGSQLFQTLLFLSPLIPGAVLGYLLKKKLCPYSGYLGAKTDPNGQYEFMNG